MADKKTEKEDVKAEEAKEEKKPAKAKKADAKKDEPKKEEPKKEEAKAEPKKAEKKEEPIKDLKDIGGAVKAEAPAEKAETPAATEKAEPREPKLDKQGRAYATGRRKDAVARVWVQSGTGKVVINGRDQSVYFARNTHRLILNQPFLIVNQVGKFDVMATVKGGGLSGQAGAVRHGISRALENFNPDLRGPLKKAGMMTRDARVVERKKVGKHKARRTKQWAKR